MSMTPLSSWALMALVLILVALVVWILRHLEKGRAEGERQAQNDVDVPLAVVTELRPAKRARHLTLVPELPGGISDLYDWEVQGI